MKFFSTEGCNIVVQLSEKKCALWLLLLGRLLQFQLNFKHVDSFHQANTWRPAAASPACGLSLQEDRAAVCVGLRGRGRLWSDFPGDQWPLIHKSAVTLAGFLKVLVTPFLSNRLLSLHITHSQILLSAPSTLRLLKPLPSLTWVRSLQKLPACSPQPRPPRTAGCPQSRQLTWCCIMCFCFLPEAPTGGQLHKARVFTSVILPCIDGPWSHVRHIIDMQYALVVLRRIVQVYLHLPGNISTRRCVSWPLLRRWIWETTYLRSLLDLTEDFFLADIQVSFETIPYRLTGSSHSI